MAVNAAAVFRVRPSGNNANGAGYDSTIGGAGTDYSQQNAAQASGTAGAASGTTAFSDTVANAFTAAMVGNAIQISVGGGMTTGIYFVTGYTSASTVTLDRSPGTGSAATWKLGGAWADFWTNTTSAKAWIVPGNTIYILGAGIPNPAAYSYDYTAPTYFQPVSGTQTAGMVTFAADPATPSYGTGGMPCIKSSAGTLFYVPQYYKIDRLWIVTFTGNVAGVAAQVAVASRCVIDQNGYDIGLTVASAAIYCEIFSSAAKVSSNSSAGLSGSNYGTLMWGNNVHDCIGPGIAVSQMGHAAYNISAKNGDYGMLITSNAGTNYYPAVYNNTVDGNAGDGIRINDQTTLNGLSLFNNVISNQTGVGKYGLNVLAGTTAANDLVKGFADYNSFYNNTANYNAISAGAHDTALGSSPYVASSTENYTLAAVLTTANALPNGAFPQHKSGQTTTVQNYTLPGAVQPQATGGGTTIVISPIQNRIYTEEAA